MRGKNKKYRFKFKVEGEKYEEILESFNDQVSKGFAEQEVNVVSLKDKIREVRRLNKEIGRDKKSGADLIYVDPPWEYYKQSDELQGTVPYATLSTPALCAMDVKRLAGTGPCACLMWATAPKWNDAQVLLRAWGFDYVTVFFCWVKRHRSGRPVLGVGHHTRANAEFLLLGRRGGSLKSLYDKKIRVKLSQILETPFAEVFEAERTKHSEKPLEARQIIERVFPKRNAPVKVELFTRHKAHGWIGFGNQEGLLGDHSVQTEITTFFKKDH